MTTSAIVQNSGTTATSFLSACIHAQADGMSYLLARSLIASNLVQAGAQASDDYVEQVTYLLFLNMANKSV